MADLKQSPVSRFTGTWVVRGKLCSDLFPSFFFPSGSSCGYHYDSNAFLFSLVNRPGWAPVKLPQTGRYSYYRSHSSYRCSSYGPTFGGGHDLYIASQAASTRNSYTNLGYTYSPPSGYGYTNSFTRSFLGGSYTFTPNEVETFYERT